MNSTPCIILIPNSKGRITRLHGSAFPLFPLWSSWLNEHNDRTCCRQILFFDFDVRLRSRDGNLVGPTSATINFNLSGK